MELLEDQANRMKQEIIIVGTFSQQSFRNPSVLQIQRQGSYHIRPKKTQQRK